MCLNDLCSSSVVRPITTYKISFKGDITRCSPLNLVVEHFQHLINYWTYWEVVVSLKYQVIWVVVLFLWGCRFENWWWGSIWWLCLFMSLCMCWLCLKCWSEFQNLHTFVWLFISFTAGNNPHWVLDFYNESLLMLDMFLLQFDLLVYHPKEKYGIHGCTGTEYWVYEMLFDLIHIGSTGA